jgi:CRP-like cAMP-binding protein
MAQPRDPRELTWLDEAWALVLDGHREGGLRRAVALLEADPMQLGAGALVAELLVSTDRKDIAGEVAKRLVDAFVRRSDLPAATAAVGIARRAGEDVAPLYRAIARAFGKGSPRLADVSPAPPPLPVEPEADPALGKLDGDVLLDRAESAARRMLAEDDPIDPGGKVSQLPLFSALAEGALERLLGVLQVRDLPIESTVIAQGDEGREAFVVVRGALRAERRAGDDDAAREVLALLGPGAIFGEMALVSDSPRAASVVALEAVQLLVASREDLERLAGTEPAIGAELSSFCRNRMMMNLVRHSAILNAVAPAQRDDLMARFRTKTIEPGESLVTEGDETEGLFLIASGHVRVTKKDADGDTLVLADLGPGDVVGEISLVLRRPASATVVASHRTVVLHLEQKQFQEAIKEHPTLLGELYELATKREEETRSVVAQQTLDVEDVVLV